MNIPEILAPAGDSTSMHIALQAGADAVYFGLDNGFNARARAANFPCEKLPEIIRDIHKCGAKAYVTLNTLVFESELESVKKLIDAVSKSKTDGIIVQDLAVALLAKERCPNLAVHASTQMTLSSSLAINFAEDLGCVRVVLPRELSLDEIADIKSKVKAQLEVFVLGALCISFSGQCLASFSWGGRSANRGQCAQSCRLPYQVILNGQERSLPVSLMNPLDLAAFKCFSKLAEIGVDSFKIEGRLKSPGYVYTAVKMVKDWMASEKNRSVKQDYPELRKDYSDLSVAYSRGFGLGWFNKIDHQNLINTVSTKHCGLLSGIVSRVLGSRVCVVPAPFDKDNTLLSPWPIAFEKGMGVLFTNPTEPFQLQTEAFAGQTGNKSVNQGGYIFSCTENGKEYTLSFGHDGPDTRLIRPGDYVYITSTPALKAKVKKAFNQELKGRIPLNLKAFGKEGTPLSVSIVENGREIIKVKSQQVLTPAQKRSLDSLTLQEKFAELGGTCYFLESFDAKNLEEGLFLPLSELKPMRRQLMECLAQNELSTKKNAAVSCSTTSNITINNNVEPNKESADNLNNQNNESQNKRYLVVMCRTGEQVKAAVKCGVEHIELDLFGSAAAKPYYPQLANLIKQIRDTSSCKITIAGPRIQKQKEHRFLHEALKLSPDGILVRNLGALQFMLSGKQISPRSNWENECEIHGDFGLNCTNSITSSYLLNMGLSSITPALDLGEEHVLDLLKALYRINPDFIEKVTVPVYYRIPAFHTQHCLYARLLSQGSDNTSCGHPCLTNHLAIKDRQGYVHTVKPDFYCRNTIYNETVSRSNLFYGKGFTKSEDVKVFSKIKRFRVELVEESFEQASTLISSFQKTLG